MTHEEKLTNNNYETKHLRIHTLRYTLHYIL